jgi:hypothetical protein
MTNAARVTVIVPVSDPGDELGAILRPIDLQDLPYDRYQVIFTDLESRDGTGARLRDLVGHRPNVAVVTAPDLQAGWRQAAELATGDYVLLLGPRDRLYPWSLRVLAEHAATTDLDVVLGRSEGIGPAGFLPDALGQDWHPDSADAGTALLAPVALIRRDLWAEVTAVGGWRATRTRLFARGAKVGVLPDVPVAVGAGPTDGESAIEAWRDAEPAAEDLPAGPVRHTFVAAHLAALLHRTPLAELDQAADEIASSVRRTSKSVDAAALPPALRGVIEALTGDASAEVSADAGQAALRTAADAVAAWSQVRVSPRDVTAAWDAGVLKIDARVAFAADRSLPAGLSEVTLDVLLREVGSSASYRIPAQISAIGSTRSVSARVDPATIAAGTPLQRGSWHILVRVRGSGADAPATAAVPYVNVGSALIDGLAIASFQQNGQLRLNVGATKHGIFGRPQPSDTSLSETAAGSLLTIRLPDLAVSGESRTSGHLYLGKFPLPATLCANDGAARIECYVSGLAGSSSLSARFPPAAQQPLGLRLRIGPVGDINIDVDRPKSPAKKKSAGTGKQPANKPAAQPSASENLQGLLRPAFRRLPAPVRRRVRQAYRAITK